MREFFRLRKTWILFLVFTGTLINAIDRSSLGTATTFIENDLHISDTTMGFILSAFGWTYLLFNIPSGWLSDRIGVKKVYAIAAAIWSLASAATGIAKGVGLLFFSRIFVGIGEAANFPVATKVIAEEFPEKERGSATGIYLAGLRLGFALTPACMIGLMVAYGSSAHPNWRMAFYVTGLGSLLWVLLWLFTYKGKQAKKTIAINQFQNHEQTGKLSLRELLSFRNTWAILFIKFFQDYLYYLFITWLPTYLTKVRHFDLKHVAFYATLPWIAGMLAQPLIGLISDVLINRGYDITRVKKTLIVIVQLLSVCIMFAGQVHSPVTAAWLIVLATAAESASTAILWSIPQDLAPKGTAGSLGGIMNTAGAVASIVSPALTGLVADHYGFSIALTLGGAMMLAAAISVIFFLKRIQPLPTKHTQQPKPQPTPVKPSFDA